MEAGINQANWANEAHDPYKWARAAAVAGFAFLALRQLPGYNIGLEFVLLLIVVLLASVSLPAGILLSLLIIGFPIFYSAPIVGVAFAVVAVFSFQYLSLIDGRAFFLLGFLLISVFFKMEWAFPLLAGFYLAGTSGFALGFCGCLLVEVMGLLLGQEAMGSIYSHGSKVLWSIPSASLPSLTSWSWVGQKMTTTGSLKVLSDFAKIAITSATLIVQPLVWGGVAAFVGMTAEKRWKNILIVFPLGLAALFTASLVTGAMYKLPTVGAGQLAVRALLGFAVAMIPVAVTMLIAKQREASGVMTASVTTGSSVAAGPSMAQPAASGAMDSLTGLFRREHLDASLPARMEAARQAGQALAFCMIDLDRFKQVNDTKGHQTGDKVLMDVAGILRSTVANAGDVIRYGGDEFCVILPGVDAEAARQMMALASSDLEAWDFVGLENVLRPTFSIGIAEFPRMATVEADLIERADQALYLSKNMGRNTITIYGEQVFREQALEITCWMAMQCFLTVNGRIRADSWRLHPEQGPIEIVTAFDYTATIPYVSKTASLVTDVKTFKSSFEGKILKINSMSDNQTRFVLLVQKEDLPIKMKEHLADFEATAPDTAAAEQQVAAEVVSSAEDAVAEAAASAEAPPASGSYEETATASQDASRAVQGPGVAQHFGPSRS